MNLEKKDIIMLAKQVANANKKAPVAYKFEDQEYSYSALNETLREQFKALAGDYNSYRRNKNDIFEIMQAVIDEVLPKKINDAYGQFAEIRQYGQGNKPQFVKRAGRNRAKQFITKVGLAGIYEVFKLDKSFYEIDTTAYGGAAQIGLEEFLDGVVDFTTLMDIVIEGLNDAVYLEIAKALGGLASKLPTANVADTAGTDQPTMDELLVISRAYGTPVIYTSLEFANKHLIPADGWISENVMDQMYNQGFLGMYKGTRVVILPQTFVDETNETAVLDISSAYIIPTNEGEMPVKIALEGETIIDEYMNKDRSREIQAFKKFGVAIVAALIMIYLIYPNEIFLIK